jgi:hypothetical protein
VASELRLPVTAETLATMVVSFIQGAAVQAVRDPARYDVAGFLAVFAALLHDPGPASAAPIVTAGVTAGEG